MKSRLIVLFLIVTAGLILAEEQTGISVTNLPSSWGLALAAFGAAISVFLAGIGSSMGIGLSASAAAGVMSENPAGFGRYLVLIALPGTQGIYGFVAAFLILQRIGAFKGPLKAITPDQGWYFFFAALPVAFACFLSAVYQGKVCANGIYMVAKQSKESGKAIVMGVFVEFYAVLGLLVSFFLINAVKM
ncbi:MAG: V-type ATP synthase subunit K [Candidatus Coatesbacteria bacterium]|nr:V-type ATP synthase subunit K [Candidatus Coatesbacteria bacterium]